MGRIAIRNIAEAVWDRLVALAERHDRSVEGEARFAIHNWVEIHEKADSARLRRHEIAERLNFALSESNRARKPSTLRPSHIAHAIGETHGEPTQAWFSGEEEASFEQLAAIARFIGVDTAWLQHGDGTPFTVEYARVPRDPSKALQWFRSPNAHGSPTREVHLIRSEGKDGALYLLKEFEDKSSVFYTTPYCISEEVGGGGRGQIIDLSTTFHLLYEYHCRPGAEFRVIGHVLSQQRCTAMASGENHPRAELGDHSRSTWWEDWWDPKVAPKDDSLPGYWPGYHSFHRLIQAAIEADKALVEAHAQIRSGKHVAFQKTATVGA